MVLSRCGDDANTTLTLYVAPADIVRKHGKTYVFDASTGDMIAELSASAADAIRAHRPTHMIYNGSTLTTEE